jgi:hypothetical protein
MTVKHKPAKEMTPARGRTFQMLSTPASEVLPKNNARYAELEENSPLDDNFQMNLSGSSDKWKFCR